MFHRAIEDHSRVGNPRDVSEQIELMSKSCFRHQFLNAGPNISVYRPSQVQAKHFAAITHILGFSNLRRLYLGAI
jgi:hypothetical protein